ncbi:MAG: CPXCG motif-containing cysteine-rich protein [Vulcanimicrobiaceae bacterium]
MPLDDDALFACPVCGTHCAVGADPTGGRRQHFIEECPVCCRPLVFDVTFDENGAIASVRAERE